MNIGNVTTVAQMESKSQNSVFGKFEFSVDKLQTNANENLNSGNGISMGESVFKNLLLNCKAVTAQASQGTQFPKETQVLTDTLVVEGTELEDQTNTLIGLNPNGMIVSPTETNVSTLELKTMMSGNAVNSVNLVSLVKEKPSTPVEAPVVSSKLEIMGTYGTVETLGTKIEKDAKPSKESVEKVKTSNSTFVKTANEKMNEMDLPAAASEGEIQQAKTDLRGIERAAFSNGKEINVAKMEMLAGIKEKKEEKPAGVEIGETVVQGNKPSNLESETIDVAFKSQKLENVPIYNQIAEEISAKLEQKGPMEFKLQLKPENLGEIDVCIKMTEGKLSIDITSANSKTQEMLVSQVDKLITKLGLQNFQVENVQVLPGTSTTTTQDQASQPSLVNLGMNFSDRRQHETLKEQNELRKSLRAMSSLNATEKQLNSGIGMVQGNHYSGHKINYSF